MKVCFDGNKIHNFNVVVIDLRPTCNSWSDGLIDNQLVAP
jgi:hypothetical protein